MRVAYFITILGIAIASPYVHAIAQEPAACIALDASASLVGGPAVDHPVDPSGLGLVVANGLYKGWDGPRPMVIGFATTATELVPDRDGRINKPATLGPETNVVAGWQACADSGASEIVFISDFAPDAHAMSRDEQLAWLRLAGASGAKIIHAVAFPGADAEGLAMFRDLAAATGGTFSFVLNQADAEAAVSVVLASHHPSTEKTPTATTTLAELPTAPAPSPSAPTPPRTPDHGNAVSELAWLLGISIALIATIAILATFRPARRRALRGCAIVADLLRFSLREMLGGQFASRRHPPARATRKRRPDGSTVPASGSQRPSVGGHRFVILDTAGHELLTFPAEGVSYVDCTGAKPKPAAAPGTEVLTIAHGRAMFGPRTLELRHGRPTALNSRFSLWSAP